MIMNYLKVLEHMRERRCLWWIHRGSDSIGVPLDRIQFQLDKQHSICHSREGDWMGSHMSFQPRSKPSCFPFDQLDIHKRYWHWVVLEVHMEPCNHMIWFDCCRHGQLGMVCIFDQLNHRRLEQCIEHNNFSLQWSPLDNMTSSCNHSSLDPVEGWWLGRRLQVGRMKGWQVWRRRLTWILNLIFISLKIWIQI